MVDPFLPLPFVPSYVVAHADILGIIVALSIFEGKCIKFCISVSWFTPHTLNVAIFGASHQRSACRRSLLSHSAYCAPSLAVLGLRVREKPGLLLQMRPLSLFCSGHKGRLKEIAGYHCNSAQNWNPSGAYPAARCTNFKQRFRRTQPM